MIGNAADWFETRILPHERAVIRVLAGFRLTPAEVEDLLQQTYVKVLEASRRGAVSSPRAFVLTTARHVAIDYLRNRRVTPFQPVPDIEALNVSSLEPGPERVAMGRSLLQTVSLAIAGLPPRCRDILLLRKIEGLSQREVAHRLGIAEDTVQKQVAKAVRLCAAALFRDDDRSTNRPAGTANDLSCGQLMDDGEV